MTIHLNGDIDTIFTTFPAAPVAVKKNRRLVNAVLDHASSSHPLAEDEPELVQSVHSGWLNSETIITPVITDLEKPLDTHTDVPKETYQQPVDMLTHALGMLPKKARQCGFYNHVLAHMTETCPMQSLIREYFDSHLKEPLAKTIVAASKTGYSAERIRIWLTAIRLQLVEKFGLLECLEDHWYGSTFKILYTSEQFF